MTDNEAQSLTDDELVSAVFDNVHGAAFFSRITHYDENCTVLFHEANRRGKPELYERGYKKAERLLT